MLTSCQRDTPRDVTRLIIWLWGRGTTLVSLDNLPCRMTVGRGGGGRWGGVVVVVVARFSRTTSVVGNELHSGTRRDAAASLITSKWWYLTGRERLGRRDCGTGGGRGGYLIRRRHSGGAGMRVTFISTEEGGQWHDG